MPSLLCPYIKVFVRFSKKNDRILDLVKERMAKGRAQYGHGLLEKSGYDWVQEAEP